MGKFGRRAFVLLVAALSMLVIAACGGDDESDSGDEGGGGAAKSGGSVTISQTSQPDHLDPALTYTVNGIEPLWLVYTPLITYPHEEGAGRRGADSRAGRGAARTSPRTARPTSSSCAMASSTPTARPVKASDFEHAIKRVLNLESGGSAFFLGIEGAQEYVDAGKCDGDITGIETDDKTGKSRST